MIFTTLQISNQILNHFLCNTIYFYNALRGSQLFWAADGSHIPKLKRRFKTHFKSLVNNSNFPSYSVEKVYCEEYIRCEPNYRLYFKTMGKAIKKVLFSIFKLICSVQCRSTLREINEPYPH